MRARDVLALALCCGIVFGLFEATALEVGARILHVPAGGLIPAEVFWYAPVTAAGFLVGVGVILIALDRLARRAGLLQLALPLFVVIGVYSFVRTLRLGVAAVAAVALAVGVAVAVSRLLARRPRALTHGATRFAIWGTAALALYAVAVPTARRVAERRALSTLPAPPADAPNVVLLVLDAVRQRDMSLHGYERETTPNLTSFARQGLVFERAFATSPWSLPSHASMLSGRYPNEMTAGHRQPLDDTHLLLSEFLGRHGYATGGFVGNLSFLQPDFGLARGFITYDSRPPVTVPTLASTWWLAGTLLRSVWAWSGIRQSIPRRPAEHVKEKLLDWVDRRGDRPFFAFVNFFDAHSPYLPPAPFDTAFGRTGRYWTSQVPRAYTPRDLEQMRAGYDGGIRYMDEQLQQLIAGLSDRGVLARTIFIVTSDHGEEFGERDPSVVEHSLTLHTSSTLIPFVLVYPPAVPAGARLRQAVSLRDIPATVVELAKIPGENPFPGVPVARYADPSPPPATPRAMSVEHHVRGKLPAWTANDGDLFGVVDGDHHYFIDATGQEHLFDLANDIDERVDLAQRPETAAERARLRALLDSLHAGPEGTLRARAPATGRQLGTGKKLRRR
jgi:arylsulfatase A-like enzyme